LKAAACVGRGGGGKKKKGRSTPWNSAAVLINVQEIVMPDLAGWIRLGNKTDCCGIEIQNATVREKNRIWLGCLDYQKVAEKGILS